VQVDATPFRQWFNQHYGVELGKKADGEKKASGALTRKREARKKSGGQIDQGVADQMKTGRLIACISSRPGQRFDLSLSPPPSFSLHVSLPRLSLSHLSLSPSLSLSLSLSFCLSGVLICLLRLIIFLFAPPPVLPPPFLSRSLPLFLSPSLLPVCK
jgi:hypothetical protein